MKIDYRVIARLAPEKWPRDLKYVKIWILKFDHSFLTFFPGDSRVYADVQATPVRRPEMLIWSADAASLIDLGDIAEKKSEYAEVFSGNRLMEGMQSYATRYGGHQFGVWAGQLGDGRALSLGETINSRGERWELQLKGAGVTPYSRRGDGRAVLRSSLREFLCSEAMFYLGVPTTRALCCVTTGEKVVRDMFYDGNPQEEEGAITTRLSPSFLRLGHFQILAADQNAALLEKLMKYAINTHFPDLATISDPTLVYAHWYQEICRRTALLMSEWTRVGFVHGVMNTDNLSILGLTIDYGPYGWMEIYNPDFTPNTTDAEHGRYRFSHQPQIAFWNLQRFGEALLFVIKDPEVVKAGLDLYVRTYNDALNKMMGRKLGISDFGVHEADADFSLLTELDDVMRAHEIDMTIFYRKLAGVRSASSVNDAFSHLAQAFYSDPAPPINDQWRAWLNRYLARAAKDSRPIEEVRDEMNRTNPYFILRNYLVQEALDELGKGSRVKMDQLMEALKTPYTENQNTQPFFKRMPDWARNRAGCSALSCSS